MIRFISSSTRFLTIVLMLGSANTLSANERLLKAIERYEAVWIGKTTVVTERDSSTSILLSVRDDVQVKFSRLDVKAGSNDLVNFNYTSLPLGQTLNHMRSAAELNTKKPERPYLGKLFDSDDQSELTQSLSLYHSFVDSEFLSTAVKSMRDQDTIKVVSENRFSMTLASGSEVEIKLDESERIVGLESEISFQPSGPSASSQQRRFRTIVEVTYDSEDAELPYEFTITGDDRKPYTLRLTSSVETSPELTDRLQLPGIEISDGTRVLVADHEDDSYVLLDGRIVAVVDSQIVADAQKARRANSSGAWLAWYATAGLVIFFAVGLLWWLRRTKAD